MDILLRVYLFATAIFYLFVFFKHTDKRVLPVSLVILFCAGLMVTLIGQISFWTSLIVAKSFPLAKSVSGAAGGFIEELTGSFLTVGIIKRSKKSGSPHVQARRYVSALAFIYGTFECARMIYQPFSSDLNVLGRFLISEVSITHPEIMLPQSPVLLSLYFLSLVMRYHIHSLLLTLSVVALVDRRWRLFMVALLMHFLAGLSLNAWRFAKAPLVDGIWIYTLFVMQSLFILLLLAVILNAKIKLPLTFKFLRQN